MTPEERELVRDLFERLVELERERRDPEAERLIREGLTRAPNATYALVQTVLLQDEGLRAADERIAELEDALARAESGSSPRPEGSFLGERRGKWNTGEVIRGSVPPAGGERPMNEPPMGSGERPMGVPPGFGRDRGYDEGPPHGQGGVPGGGPWSARQAGPQGGEPGRGGGSFLGTAAAVAAGAIGGGLLMGGIQSALGGQGGRGPFAGAIDQLTGRTSGAESGGAGDLAREAGLHDIGGSGRRAGAMGDASAPAEDSATGYSAEEDNSDLDHDEMHDIYEEDTE